MRPDMSILIFKTTIKSKKSVRAIKPLLDAHPLISGWSVDLDDIDKVLRIVASGGLQEDEIIGILATQEHYSEVLSC